MSGPHGVTLRLGDGPRMPVATAYAGKDCDGKDVYAATLVWPRDRPLPVVEIREAGSGDYRLSIKVEWA